MRNSEAISWKRLINIDVRKQIKTDSNIQAQIYRLIFTAEKDRGHSRFLVFLKGTKSLRKVAFSSDIL